MTEPLAAQEDKLILPAEWLDRLLPRRGNRVRRPVELIRPRPPTCGAVIDDRFDDLVAVFEHPACDPDLGKGALAHLNGDPNPTSAGALLTVLRFTEQYGGGVYQHSAQNAKLNRELFSALAIEYRAAVRRVRRDRGPGDRVSWGTPPVPKPSDLPSAAWGSRNSLKWLVLSDPRGVLPLARCRLAQTDEGEYRQIVALASAHRDTEAKRLAAAILLPDELDWVAEACDERPMRYGAYTPETLIWSMLGTEDHLRRTRTDHLSSSSDRGVIAELVANLGAAALPIFSNTLRRSRIKYEERALLFEAIALLPSDAAMELLVEHGGELEVLPAFREVAVRFPHRLARAVAARIASIDHPNRSQLAGAFRADAIPLDSVLAGLSEADRAAFERMLEESALPVARLDALPEAFVSPPRAARRKRRSAALDGLAPPDEIAIIWRPGEYERAMAIEPFYREWDEDAYWSITDDAGLGAADGLWGRLARGGATSVGELLERMREVPKSSQALVPILSAEAAMLAADWFARLKSARAHAVDWLDRHGVDAVPMLVPGALGGDTKQRAGGEAALRYLGSRLGSAAVAGAAEPYGTEAVARIRDLLDTDPNVPFAGQSKPGPWADPSMLPTVTLRGGAAALPAEAVAHLITALALWSSRVPFPGVDLFAEHCDEDSLRRFSQALFDLWIRADAPSKDSWVVDQLARFGDDATVAALAPLVADWPSQGFTDRALSGLDVLAHIGTDAAFIALQRMAEADKYSKCVERAREYGGRIAAARGLTLEECGDRLVPDHDVSDPDGVVFDYGARRFRLRFDASPNPRLTDDTGRERPRLPKPGVRDDEALGKASIKRYKSIVKAVESTAEEAANRLPRTGPVRS